MFLWQMFNIWLRVIINRVFCCFHCENRAPRIDTGDPLRGTSVLNDNKKKIIIKNTGVFVVVVLYGPRQLSEVRTYYDCEKSPWKIVRGGGARRTTVSAKENNENVRGVWEGGRQFTAARDHECIIHALFINRAGRDISFLNRINTTCTVYLDHVRINTYGYYIRRTELYSLYSSRGFTSAAAVLEWRGGGGERTGKPREIEGNIITIMQNDRGIIDT